ncbi:MAG: hypothetical protein ACKO83_13630, partial [Roseiflexaceae bacterium]
MRFLHSWMLRILMVGMIAAFLPAAPTHAAAPTWQDLPDTLFDRFVCFDGNNADVIWARDGNAYAWKTSTKLTNYTTSQSRSMGTQWCSDDGFFYNTEYTLVYDDTTSEYDYISVTLLRRSLTQAPAIVTTLSSAFVNHHSDFTGKMSILAINERTLVTSLNSNGTSWSTQTHTFADPIQDVFVPQHNASHIYAITMPPTWYRPAETLPSTRTISQFSVWKSSDAGRTWRTQAQVNLPQSCAITVLPETGATTDYTACYWTWLNVQFVPAPTRYTSPDAVAVKITSVKNGLVTGKSIFSRDSGRTWQDMQQIQGVSGGYGSFFNDSTYPSRMYRPIPELLYTPSSIYVSAYVSQHLQTTHAYDPISNSITRAPAMGTNDQRTWYPMTYNMQTACEDTNTPLGNQVVTVATMPLVRVCKNNDGIAYLDIGAWQWRQISDDNPYARLIAVSDTLPLT